MGVRRRTVCKWIDRYETPGSAGLRDRSMLSRSSRGVTLKGVLTPQSETSHLSAGS
ncbi:MAG: leucine zipper domain-containing protein [Gammaproteobacteria bacterium]|nr:leucine zipper domain-containing protein [Gammaproteobacteria bacterium]